MNRPFAPTLHPDAILTGDAELRPFAEPDGQLFYEPASGRIVLRDPHDRAADAVPATELVRGGFFADEDAKGTAAVLRRLEVIADDGDDDLVFDPATGRLTVRGKGQVAPGPDAVSAVQMARTGFFGGERSALRTVVQVPLERGLARRAVATVDLTAAVRDIASAAKEYAVVRERERSRREAIAAYERVELARLDAQREVVLSALDRSFDERAANFRQLFAALDRALEGGDAGQVGAVTTAISELAAVNPFVALRDVASVQAAASDPNHVWNL